MNINKFKNKIKGYWDKNKEKIKTTGKWTLRVATIFGMGALIINNKRKNNVINSLNKDNEDLTNLCYEKDSFFTEMISDGLRHKSKLASKHMRDRNAYLNGK